MTLSAPMILLIAIISLVAIILTIPSYAIFNPNIRKVDKQFIPKNIFQTHKTIEYINNDKMLENAQKSWKNNKEYSYHFYDNYMCDSFMKKEFSKIYHIYKKLPIPVQKADMWRYCILYKYGGIYADSDTVCKVQNLNNVFNKNSLLIGVPEHDIHLCQWIFAAPKGSPILKSVIDLLVERVEKEKTFKGKHITHYLTGPGVFTDGVENYLKKHDQKIEKNKTQYKNHKNRIIHIYDPSKFHKETIKHLFTGQRKDGWCNDVKKFNREPRPKPSMNFGPIC